MCGIIEEMGKLGDAEKAAFLSRYFKTRKGQYGEGDVFLGITVPEQRRIAGRHAGICMGCARRLLGSKIHEHRMVALLILSGQYRKSDEAGRKRIFDFYVRNRNRVNNWDLVDLSAPNIVGKHLLCRDRALLYRLAVSDSLWDRRIAIVSTLEFIRNNDFGDTLKIAGSLLDDRHDLIHKAAGWMLREVGKRNLKVEEQFLKKHCRKMPRTMLRYAVEKLPENRKKFYMKK